MQGGVQRWKARVSTQMALKATKMGAGPGLLGEMVPQTQTLAHEYKDGRGG